MRVNISFAVKKIMLHVRKIAAGVKPRFLMIPPKSRTHPKTDDMAKSKNVMCLIMAVDGQDKCYFNLAKDIEFSKGQGVRVKGSFEL